MGTGTGGKEISIKIYDLETLEQIRKEVANSGLRTRNRFCNEAFKELLSLPPVFDRQSKLEELIKQRSLWDQIPYSVIHELAPIHNRTFEQMFVHVLQVGLRPYLGHNSPSPVD